MQDKSSENDSETRVEAALFQISLPADLLGRIKAQAKSNERSANREIVYALRQRYEVQHA